MVAEQDGCVIALCHAYARPALDKPPEVIVQALVVDQASRGRGVGKIMMAAAETWAADRGFKSVALASHVVLKISPIEKSTPPEAEALAARLYAMLPRIRIIDLLAEVATWTQFPDCFTHLRSGETAGDGRILMAGLLADGSVVHGSTDWCLQSELA